VEHNILSLPGGSLWGSVGGGVWHAVGCLRHQTPAPGFGGYALVGFLVFDFWIVDASNTHTVVWVLV
jgi:hypothetical protein